MESLNIESVVFYILLIDALGANIAAWSGVNKWWMQHYSGIACHLPLTKGWGLVYISLVLIMGIMLCHNDILVVPFI